jgi:malonate decarboxylase delta subunit
MERLAFRFDGGQVLKARSAQIVGVVGSGNLEVLIESVRQNGACVVDVNTAARGFAATWEAVVRDFFERHRPGDVCVSINDAGATPATVALRLDQAFEVFVHAGP